jgi:hypothetical protein
MLTTQAGREQIEIDKCLDGGSRWNHKKASESTSKNLSYLKAVPVKQRCLNEQDMRRIRLFEPSLTLNGLGAMHWQPA